MGEALQKSAIEEEVPENNEELVRSYCQEVVRKYALEAAWPTNKKDPVKNILYRMSHELSAAFGRSVEDVSLEDISRAQTLLENMCSKVGLHKLRFGRVRSVKDAYDRYSYVITLISNANSIGSLFFGNFGPLVRKLGWKVSGAPLGRSVGVWLAGQIVTELYWDPENFKGNTKAETHYHPLFDAFNLDQLRELALLVGIDPRVSWSPEKIKKEILTELTSVYHNKVAALWSDAPDYKDVLMTLCEELEVDKYLPNDSEELLEERIVQRVLAQSVEKMTPEQLKEFERAIKNNIEDNYWSSSIKS